MEKTIVLGIGETAFAGELELRLKGIVVEEIAPSRDGAYPAGSGISVSLSLKKGEKSADISLNKLSEGYESKLVEEWGGYSVQLVEADDKHVKVKLWNSR